MICLYFLGVLAIVEAGVFNRFYPNPRATVDENLAPHKTYIDKDFKKVECVASFGLTPDMKNSAEKAIIKHYSGIVENSGNEADKISEEMEKNYGGYWMVGMFSADFDAAYTITKRSKNYGLYVIDDKMILIAKDGNPKPHDGPVY